MDTSSSPPGYGQRYRIRYLFAVTPNHNPYRPASVSEQGFDDDTPAWRLAFGSLLRICGAILVVLPLVAFVLDFPGARSDEYMNDLTGIMTAIFCYIGVGGLMIAVGNKISPRRRKSKTESHR